MCLHDELPGPVAEALARYRRIPEQNGPNWAESHRSYYGDHDAVVRVGDREVIVPAGRARTLQLAIAAAQIEVSVDGVAVAVPDSCGRSRPSGCGSGLRRRPGGPC